jgi:hypothetical protein
MLPVATGLKQLLSPPWLWIIILDGLMGAAIPLISLWSVARRSAPSHAIRFSELFRRLTDSSIPHGVASLLGCGFVATVALTPLVLVLLRRRLHKRFYFVEAALAGIAFGVVATAGLVTSLGLLGALAPDPRRGLGDRLVLAVAAPIFGAVAGPVMALVGFPREIVVAGTAFGLLNGVLVRLVSRRAEPVLERRGPN